MHKYVSDPFTVPAFSFTQEKDCLQYCDNTEWRMKQWESGIRGGEDASDLDAFTTIFKGLYDGRGGRCYRRICTSNMQIFHSKRWRCTNGMPFIFTRKRIANDWY